MKYIVSGDWLTSILWLVVGFLLCYTVCEKNSPEPLIFNVPAWKEKIILQPKPYIVTSKAETIYVTQNTPIGLFPIETYEHEFSIPAMVNKQSIPILLMTSVKYQGNLFEVQNSAGPIDVIIKQNAKIDWKLIVIAFGAGFVLDRVILNR